MLVLVHTVVGVSIASVIRNPYILIPTAFGSHFVLDAIPHNHLKDESKYIKVQAFIDIVFSIGFLTVISIITKDILYVVGALSASIMDLDTLLHHYGIKTGRRIHIFPHVISSMHGTIQNETTHFGGIVSQIVITLISLILIAR